MTITHHPSDETILNYGNGSLNRALALVVHSHCSGCAACRETLDVSLALGGAFLESIEPAAMGGGALARTLERLDSTPADPRAALAGHWPVALQHHITGRKRWLAPGIWMRPVLKDREAGTRVYLLGASAGKSLPHHGHQGIELTQVLEGAFFEGERRYGAGDFLEADGEHAHRPVVAPDRDCVCLIASQGVPRGLPGLLMRILA